MKTNTGKLRATFFGMAISVATFSGAMANNGAILNSDPIDINGYVSEEQNVSDAELENVKSELRKQKTAIVVNKQKKKKYGELSRSTEKLADVTEDMIEERKESQVTIDKFNKKIDCLMAEGQKEGCEEFVRGPKEDTISVQQAAPVAPQVIEAPIQAPSNVMKFGSTIKVLPYSGLTTLMSDNESLEAGLVGGIKIESNANGRVSVGVGFNYTSLATTDFGGSNYMNSGYVDYYESYYGGREIEYSNMNFDIYSKFFMLDNDKFRPYVGAGIGYNRTTMAYADNNQASSSYNGQYYGYSFGKEEVTTSNVNIELMIGSEVKFTDSIGANLELNYSRSLGGNLSAEKGVNPYLAPDQQRLEDLSDELGESNIVSLFAGMLIEF
jgi:opacity protein-like surface antigen